jgi:hypothetical protein
MEGQPRITYGIEAIHDCIVADTDVYKKFKSKEKKRSLYRKKKKLLDKYPALKKTIDAPFVRSLNPERGQYVGKVGWMPAELVISDQRIREMCRNMFLRPEEYAKKTGIRFGPCPGLETMSACPMFSPGPKEIRVKLDKADIFIAMQSKNFVERAQIPGWHDFLITKLKKEIEQIVGKGSVTIAFGAGPCQVCHPKPCGDESWKIKWIKYFGTPKQTRKQWKLTAGLAVRLNSKKH